MRFFNINNSLLLVYWMIRKLVLNENLGLRLIKTLKILKVMNRIVVLVKLVR